MDPKAVISTTSPTAAVSKGALDLLQFKHEFLAGSPVTAFQYLDVTFGSSANADNDIKHNLSPQTTEQVDYLVVRKDRAADVYHDQSGTRKAWGAGYIILRCSVASAKVTLLLTTRRV